MKRLLIVLCLSAATFMAAAGEQPSSEENAMLKKLTPVLLVDSIEEQLPFWMERLGFQKTIEVPHENALGFVILVRDGVELMIQTHASVAADMPALANERAKVPMFIEVADIDDIERRLAEVPKVFDRRTTFYGATEIGVRDPAGNMVTFAEFADPATP